MLRGSNESKINKVTPDCYGASVVFGDSQPLGTLSNPIITLDDQQVIAVSGCNYLTNDGKCLASDNGSVLPQCLFLRRNPTEKVAEQEITIVHEAETTIAEQPKMHIADEALLASLPERLRVRLVKSGKDIFTESFENVSSRNDCTPLKVKV